MNEIIDTPQRPLAVMGVFIVAGPLIGAAVVLLPLAALMILTLNGASIPGLLALGYPFGVVPAALTGAAASLAIARWPRSAFLPTCAIAGALSSSGWELIMSRSAELGAWLPFSMLGAVGGLGCAGLVDLLGLRGREAPKARTVPPPGPGRRLTLRAGDVLLIALGVVMAVMIATLLIPALV